VSRHAGYAVAVDRFGIVTYSAHCACGWQGSDTLAPQDAAQTLAAHIRRATAEDAATAAYLARNGTHWRFNDGGREAAGYRGSTGDCVIRALTLATYPEVVAHPDIPEAGTRYKSMYDALQRRQKAYVKKTLKQDTLGRHSVRNGVINPVYREMLKDAGWRLTATKAKRPRVHLRAEELPAGRLIVEVNRHLVAVIDGVIYDTFDSSRDGTRPVYSYWEAPNA
jgi:hypothetical protein